MIKDKIISNHIIINKEYGSDKMHSNKNKKENKIGNFADSFAEMIPNLNEKEKKNEIYGFEKKWDELKK